MAATNKRNEGAKRRPAKRDSVTVRGRFSPQKQDGLWYESWIIEYSFHGKRSRERRNSLRAAKACAEAAATKLARGEMEALELREEDRRILPRRMCSSEAPLRGEAERRRA